MKLDRVARLATIAFAIALAVIGLALPGAVLAGGAAWLSFLFFAASGWGWLAVRAARTDDPDFGLRAAWGVAAYLAVAGLLVMVGACSRPAVLALLAVGVGGFAWRELVTPHPLWQIARDGVRAARARPLVAYAAILIAALALVHVLGAVVRLDRNPWDDDLAYTPFAKRLLDSGDLIEPFSFRRLAAYGGQIALEALGGARGTLANVHLIDQGLCFGLVLLGIVGHARALARVPALWLAAVVLAVVALPDISINTASYWSGALLLLAMYRTVVRGELVLAAFVAAAACTLRQTYIPVAVVFLAIAAWRGRADRRVWARGAGVFAGVLLPWCIASLVACHTFLFPFVAGTFNHGLSLAPAGWSWTDELGLLFGAIVDAQPLFIVVLLVPLVAFSGDDRPARPLGALLVASLVGFLLMVHSFADADTFSLWRYAFGYTVALFAVFALEVGSEHAKLPALGRWVVLAAIVVQLAGSRGAVVKQDGFVFRDLREAAAIGTRGDPNARAEAARYAKLQAAVPAGGHLLVMVDDPAFLDYHRNRIANLDTPGFASPGTQLPAFAGADAWRAYIVAEGYRYVAFVRSEHSRYFFRREFWIWRLFHDSELFQAMSAYTIDAIDTMAQLAQGATVLYDQDGLVALDLGSASEVIREPAGDEATRRDTFVHALAQREHLEGEWLLASRRDIAFEDGLSDQTYVQAADDARWMDFFVRDPAPRRGQPIRWMSRRVHFRVRGDGVRHLVLRGRVNTELVFTRPRLDVSRDGELLGSFSVDASGAFTVELDVAASRAWGDLYVVFNTIGQAERDVRDLRLARLEEVRWEPR